MTRNTNAKGEATKQRIVAAAADLIHRHGFNATGMNQIIKNSGAPKGSLYFHFPEGKEQIIEAALRASGEQVSLLLQQAFGQGENLQQALDQCISYFKSELITTGFSKGCPVATVALETAGDIDRMQTVCEEIYGSWLSILKQGLGDAKAEQAEIILMLIEGALVLSKANKSVEPLEKCSAHLAAILVENG